MKKNKNKTQAIIGLILLGLLCWGAFAIISFIWKALSEVDVKLAAALIVSGATIIVSVISITIGKYLEQKSSQKLTQAEKKIPTYEKIVQLIFEITFAEKLGKKPPNEKELIKTLAGITQELVIWGSDDVIDAFYKFRMESIQSEEQGTTSNILFKVEDLLIAVRKDLGHKKVKRGKILGLFVNDIEKYL